MKNAFIVLLVLLPLLQACNLGQDKVQPKQEQATAEEESSSVEVISATEWQSRFASVAVKDGILQFEDANQFHTLTEQFFALSPEEQAQAAKRSDFKSFYNKYGEVLSQLTNAKDEQTVRSIFAQFTHVIELINSTVEPTLGDINDGINMVLNEYGFVSINGVMHLYNKDGIFSSKTANPIEILDAASSLNSTEEIDAYLHPQSQLASSERASCNSFTERRIEQFTTTHTTIRPHVKTRFRIRGSSYHVNNGNGAYITRPAVEFKGTAYRYNTVGPFAWWGSYSTIHYKEYSITARVRRRPYESSVWNSHYYKKESSSGNRSPFSVGGDKTDVAAEDLHLFIPTIEYSNSKHSHQGMDASNPSNWAVISCAN
ncbi:MAG: hypothetical protein AAFQ68_11400 [Bacteroidota bacterium]